MSTARPGRVKRHPVRLVLELFALMAVIIAATIGLRGTYQQYYTAAYPDGYGEEVQKYAAMYDLSPSLVYAIIRVESNFNPNAESGAGAIGLMQITPITLDWVQVRGNFADDLTEQSLFDSATNIRCGAFALSLLYELFDDEDTVIAAYNAGLGNVQDWLDDPRYSADGVTLKTIPFEETANYVQRVRSAQASYQQLYHIP